MTACRSILTDAPGRVACIFNSRRVRFSHPRLVPTMRSSGFAIAVLSLALFADRAAADELAVFPASFTLHGKAARQRLIVTLTSNGQAVDATRNAKFHSGTPAVVQVSADGIVT